MALSGEAFGKALTGAIDCLAEQKNGNEAIIDFKYGGRSKYQNLIKDGKAVQLATYAYGRSLSANAFPAVAYLVLSDGLLFTPSESPIDGDSNRFVVDGIGIQQVWNEFAAAIQNGDRWLTGEELVTARPLLAAEHWPDGAELVLEKDLESDALIAPEGVERSIREENENLRLLYVGCTRARQKLVFAHRSNKYALLALLPHVDTLLNPDLDAGEHKLDGIETTYVIRHLAANLVEGLAVPAANQSAWISQKPVAPAVVIAPRFHSPSQADGAPDGTTFDITELPGASFFPPKTEEAEYAAIGNAVHGYMAALPSIRTLTDADKMHVAERCLSAYSVSGLVPPTFLISAGQRFCNWAEATYPGAVWHVEVPVSGPRSQGGQWAGTADWLLELPGGVIVIIDHKSAPIRREHCAKKATEFVGQLSAYSEVFEQAGTSIDSMWVHFPLAGVVGQAKVR